MILGFILLLIIIIITILILILLRLLLLLLLLLALPLLLLLWLLFLFHYTEFRGPAVGSEASLGFRVKVEFSRVRVQNLGLPSVQGRRGCLQHHIQPNEDTLYKATGKPGKLRRCHCLVIPLFCRKICGGVCQKLCEVEIPRIGNFEHHLIDTICLCTATFPGQGQDSLMTVGLKQYMVVSQHRGTPT